MLLAHGHPQAGNYPIGLLTDESSLVVDMLNRKAATETVLQQMAISAIFSKEAGEEFGKHIKKLME